MVLDWVVDLGAVLMKCSSKNPQKAQKKWLAGAAANHLLDSLGCFPRRNQFNEKPNQSKTKEHRLKPVLLLGRKRAAAAAVARRVGILENESLAHQRFFVLERRAVQIEETLRINEDACAKFLEDLVAVAGLGVQPHGIGEAGAAATLHAHAQAADIRRYTFLFKQRADFLSGALGEVDLCDTGDSPLCICVSVHFKALMFPLSRSESTL